MTDILNKCTSDTSALRDPSTITQQIDDKFKLIDDLIIQNNALPLEEKQEDYLARQRNHGLQIQAIKGEIKDLLMQNSLYKRVIQMKLYGII